MAHDVFISYGSPDKQTADATCAWLEAKGIRCWIAPRDVRPGMPYGGELTNALRESRILVLILSSHANYSSHVAREVEQAAHFGVRILPLRVEEVKPSDDLQFFINSVHWLDAFTPPLEAHLHQVSTAVERLLQPDPPLASPIAPRSTPPVPSAPVAAPKPSAPARSFVIPVAAAAVAAAAVWFALRRDGAPAAPAQAPATVAAQPAATATPSNAEAPPAGSPAASAQRAAPAPVATRPVREAPLAAPQATTPTVPAPEPVTTAAAAATPSRSFVGCWRYSTGAIIHILADGTIEGAALPGTWKPAGDDRMLITWPVFVDRITMNNDGSRLRGLNNYNLPARAEREGEPVTDRRSLVGEWRYNGSLPTVATADGGITAGQFRGKWRATGDGAFEIVWTHRPVDDLGLGSSGNSLMGSNNYGAMISATRSTCGA